MAEPVGVLGTSHNTMSHTAHGACLANIYIKVRSFPISASKFHFRSLQLNSESEHTVAYCRKSAQLFIEKYNIEIIVAYICFCILFFHQSAKVHILSDSSPWFSLFTAWKAVMSSTDGSPFMQLPTEIREMILRYVLVAQSAKSDYDWMRSKDVSTLAFDFGCVLIRVPRSSTGIAAICKRVSITVIISIPQS